jgi:hypothetical protein
MWHMPYKRDELHNRYRFTLGRRIVQGAVRQARGGKTVTISQILGHIKHQEEESADQRHRVLVIVRRCLIWTVITLAASWVISSHVFATTIVPVPDEVMAETSESPMPEAVSMQPAGCDDVPFYNYDGIFNPRWKAACGPAPMCHVGPAGRYWFEADYLLWWTKGSRVVPLISTGTIGQAGTQILYGNDRYDLGSRSNFGFDMGMWFDEGCTFGIDLDFFTLGKVSERASFSSDGNTTLAQPYYNVDAAANASRLIAGSSGGFTYSGAMDARQSEYFQSFALTFRINLGCNDICCGCGSCGDGCCEEECGSCCDGCYPARTRADLVTQRFLGQYGPDSWRLDFVTGWRTCRLNERTTLNATSSRAGGGWDVNSWDAFKSQNEFHGGDLGLLAQFYRGRWSLDVLAKVGLGNQNQTVRIDGQTVITTGAGATTYERGMFALGSNSGHYSRDKFVAVPEIGLELGYQLNGNLRATFGYNFIYWSNVVRSSEQISSQIDPDQIPPSASAGATQPAFSWNDSDYWAQGLTFGLEARF